MNVHGPRGSEESTAEFDPTSASCSSMRQEAYVRLERIVPGLPGYASRIAHQDINARGVLSAQRRELVILGMLVALGDTSGQLRAHAEAAFEAGLSHRELRELIIQGIPYVGLPRCINAAFALERLLVAPMQADDGAAAHSC